MSRFGNIGNWIGNAAQQAGQDIAGAAKGVYDFGTAVPQALINYGLGNSNDPNATFGNAVKNTNLYQDINPTPTRPTFSGNTTNQVLTANGIQTQGPSLAPNPHAPMAGGTNDLSANFANYNGTIYNKATGRAYSTPSEFYRDAGVNSFNNLKFDTAYTPAPELMPGYAGTPSISTASSDVSGGAQNVTGAPSDVTGNVTTSDTYTNPPTTNSDINSLLSDYSKRLDALFTNLANASQTPQSMLDLQNNQAQYDAQVREASGQAAGVINPDNKAIPLEFLQGQGRTKLFQAENQAGVNAALLNYAQGNRQFAYNAAQGLFDAGSKTIPAIVDLYSKTAPQYLGTQYNQLTGNIYTQTRNPLTGETTMNLAGNIGPQKSYLSTNITTLPDGSTAFVGTRADGSIDVHPLFDASGQPMSNSSGSYGAGGQYSGGVQFVPPSQPTMRTDRNNNPIAAAVKTGGSNQFTQALDQAGIKWTYGDSFGSGMSTIKIQGDPVEASRAILSNSNAIQGWYANHSGKAVLAQYGIKNNTEFAQASPQVQDAIIQGIYKGEGGKGTFQMPQATTASAPASMGSVNSVPMDQVKAALPPALASALKQTADGTYYFDGNQLPDSASIKAAQAWEKRTGIHYVSSTAAGKLQNVDVTEQNLNDLRNLVNSTFSNAPGVLGKAANMFKGSWLSTTFGSDLQTKIQEFRTSALNAIQGLAGGDGSGLRITNSEIATATNNLPTTHDTKDQALTKLNALESQLTKWKSTILPGSSSLASSKASSILDNLIQQNGG